MEDNLECQLELKGQDGELEIPCANISNVVMRAHTYGFNGSVSFVVDKEAESDFFFKLPVLEATLKIKSFYAGDDVEPIEFTGIVTSKGMHKEAVNAFNPDEVQKREFHIDFSDPAAAIWSHLFRIEIFTEKSMKDVIETFTSEKITVNYESEKIEEETPLIALGLDKRNGVSFYSFLMWHLNETGEVWEYNYAEKEYTIRSEKNPDAEPVELPFDQGGVSIFWPQPPRHNQRVLNSYADDPQNKEISGDETHENISADTLNTTSLAEELDKIAEKLTPKPNTFEHQMRIDFSKYPEMNLIPGGLYSFAEDSDWSKGFFFKEKTFRLRSVFLSLNSQEDTYASDKPSCGVAFGGSIEGVFETQEEVDIHRPPFFAPLYPLPLEGKIFSEVGDEEELTFEIEEDDETKQLSYTVELPWADGQKVSVPFEPLYTNGQTYEPLLKGERVLVHFYPFEARIVKVLEWLGCAQLPHKIEGNRTVFAPRNEDKSYTLMENIDDDGDLTFTIQRKSEDQIQFIRIKEDGLHITVHKDEEDDPQCHLWMDNEHTITITSQNTNEGQTQKITLKPEEISTICESGGDKSSIIQTPTSITIECDEFNLKTKETTLNSDENSSFTAKQFSMEGSQGTVIQDGAKIDITSSAVNIG